jgi:hypothetical protein
MPGLDTGIHPASKSSFAMDRRVKPGDDKLN